MDFILDAIESTSQHGHSFPAIVTALTVPDIAGAVDTPNAGSQVRYAKWVDDWFSPSFPCYAQHHIDGFGLYALRCKLLHEGLTNPFKAPAAAKSSAAAHKRLIAFNVGPGTSMHLCTSTDASGDTWTILRSETFCEEIVAAARKWLVTRKADPAAMKRLRDLVDVRLDVPPLSRGVPLICAAI
jgi:hypothetical protein